MFFRTFSQISSSYQVYIIYLHYIYMHISFNAHRRFWRCRNPCAGNSRSATYLCVFNNICSSLSLAAWPYAVNARGLVAVRCFFVFQGIPSNGCESPSRGTPFSSSSYPKIQNIQKIQNTNSENTQYMIYRKLIYKRIKIPPF